MNDPLCLDCKLPYSKFGLDLTLPNKQWFDICPEDGLLCGACICQRASKLKGCIAIRAVVEIKQI